MDQPTKSINCRQFWGAMQIYTEKPHIINRRLCGLVNLWCGITAQALDESFYKQLNCILNTSKGATNKVMLLNYCKKAKINEEFNCMETDKISNINNFKENEDKSEIKVKNVIEKFLDFSFLKINSSSGYDDKEENGTEAETHPSIPWQELNSSPNIKVAVLRKLLPKQLAKFKPLLEIVIIDNTLKTVSYVCECFEDVPSVAPRINYTFNFTNLKIELNIICKGNRETLLEDPNLNWLKSNVLPKISKWAREIGDDGTVDDRGSLKLVNVQEYNCLYQELKVKYGQPLVKMWPETTDPLKFVYEDVAIATYLILLWRQERKSKGISKLQSFVDLGCGNGLLVFILSSEGHEGLGIDLKKRKIWDMFPQHVKLEIGTVEPSDKSTFPEYDWLIGNHSDELTPWLPVIATKSSYATRFFVIPCCAHDFDCKYRRQRAGLSQYSDFLEYVKEITAVCGFRVWQDKLRIPSTKRICFVGQERAYSEIDLPNIVKTVDDFIKKRCKSNYDISLKQANHSSNNLLNETQANGNSLWYSNFKARDAVQAVRNCTQLEQGVKENLIMSVISILLAKKQIIEVNVSKDHTVAWDIGSNMTLGDLANNMEPLQLAALKKECGGLQTLLRNHKHIFKITKGLASLQIPIPSWKSNVPIDHLKTKPCWINRLHPQGCPIGAKFCMYSHGNDI